MKSETFAFGAGSIFLLIALLHLARIIGNWRVTVNGWELPLSLSLAAALTAGFFAIHGLKLAGKL